MKKSNLLPILSLMLLVSSHNQAFDVKTSLNRWAWNLPTVQLSEAQWKQMNDQISNVKEILNRTAWKTASYKLSEANSKRIDALNTALERLIWNGGTPQLPQLNESQRQRLTELKDLLNRAVWRTASFKLSEANIQRIDNLKMTLGQLIWRISGLKLSETQKQYLTEFKAMLYRLTWKTAHITLPNVKLPSIADITSSLSQLKSRIVSLWGAGTVENQVTTEAVMAYFGLQNNDKPETIARKILDKLTSCTNEQEHAEFLTYAQHDGLHAFLNQQKNAGRFVVPKAHLTSGTTKRLRTKKQAKHRSKNVKKKKATRKKNVAKKTKRVRTKVRRSRRSIKK